MVDAAVVAAWPPAVIYFCFDCVGVVRVL